MTTEDLSLKKVFICSSQVNATEVGWLFVQQYYSFLHSSPERLHLFYNANSVFIHGYEGEDSKPLAVGQQEINLAIQQCLFKNARVLVSSVDSQPSCQGGVVVQVLGEMSSAGEQQASKFAQTFFLAEQPEGYYVLNDIFRFLKEDFDDDSLQTESAKPPANSAHPANTLPQKEIKVELKQQSQKATEQQPQKQPTTIQQQPQKVAPVPTQQEPLKTPVKQETPDLLQKVQHEKVLEEKNPTPTPPQPKSWAALVNNPPNASQTVISTPAPLSAASNKPAVQPKKESIKSTTDQPNSQQESKQQTNSQDSKQQTNSQETNGEFRPVPSRRNDEKYRRTDEKDKLSIYIKTIPDSIDKQQIANAFSSAVGPVRHVDIPSGRNMAFVEFINPESVSKALVTEVFTTTGVQLIAEERKKTNNRSNSGRYDRNNSGYQSGRQNDRNGSSNDRQRPKGNYNNRANKNDKTANTSNA